MADTINLTLSMDKTNYNPGDLMTMSVSGTASTGSGTPATTFTPTANVRLSDGTVVPLTGPTVTINATSPQSLTFAITQASGDSKVWAVASGGQSASVTA